MWVYNCSSLECYLKTPNSHTYFLKCLFLFLFLFPFSYFHFFNRLGLQPRIREPRDDQRPPAPTSERCSDPHVWTSSNDSVCLHSQPGQTGLHQGHEVLFLKTDNSVILCRRGKKSFNGERSKLQRCLMHSAGKLHSLKMHFFLNLWQVRHFKVQLC